MKTEVAKHQQRDLGGILVAAILIVVGAVAMWETTDMTDADSFIFPRAVAISMMTFCIVFIIMQIVSPSIGTNDEAGATGGSTPRRIGLIVAMVGSSLLMPWLGFLVSGAIAFGAIMMFAMYDEWTGRRRWAFPLTGIVIVVGFYFVFAELLLVPLPVGSIFE